MWSKAAIAAVGLAASVGIGGAAYAATNNSSSHATGAATATAGTAASSQAAGRGGKAKGLYARTDHATVEVKRKGQWVTYDLDRGTVTAVSATSITLARPDGQSVTEAINSETKYKGVTSAAAIQTGRPALVLSENGTAVRIRQVTGSGTAASAGAGGSVA